MLVKFHGARKETDGDYIDRGPIWINADMISAIYDHTILIAGNTIRIMESAKEAIELIRKERGCDYGKP